MMKSGGLTGGRDVGQDLEYSVLSRILYRLPMLCHNILPSPEAVTQILTGLIIFQQDRRSLENKRSADRPAGEETGVPGTVSNIISFRLQDLRPCFGCGLHTFGRPRRCENEPNQRSQRWNRCRFGANRERILPFFHPRWDPG